eukprot:jgi/Astpho2/7247/Aster-01555
MAQVLEDQGAKQLSELKQIIKTTGKVADAASTSGSCKVCKPCLNDVIKAYNDLLKLNTETSSNRPLPVISIDEANVLMKWYKGGAAMEADLDALLSFLVDSWTVRSLRPRWSETSRSQRHGYILSIPWGPASQMLSGLRSLRCVSMRVSKGHPLLCCLFTVKCSGGCRMPLEHLVMNIQVCGGNAGYLLRASRHFRTLKDWTQALKKIWRIPLNEVESGINEGLPWSQKQYCTILQLV